jgi:folate-binding Fe-S cluster repair protein YgfZ
VELTVNHLQGCYIGQETLSKPTNLNAVKQQLWGFVLDAPVGPGSDITDKVSVAL